MVRQHGIEVDRSQRCSHSPRPANVLASAFRDRGIDARVLVGTTAPRQRLELLDDFRQGVFPVLVNCAILTEGADVPSIDCVSMFFSMSVNSMLMRLQVLMARPTKSKNLFSQMIGRGLRHSRETAKHDCLILDVVGSANRDLVCAPTLFGLDPRAPLDGMSSICDTRSARLKFVCSFSFLDESAERLVERSKAETSTPQSDERRMSGEVSEEDLMYRDFSVEDLMAHGPTKSDAVTSVSQLAWVPCGNSIFVLELMNQSYIRVEPEFDSGESIERAMTSLEKIRAELMNGCDRTRLDSQTGAPTSRDDTWKQRSLLGNCHHTVT